MQDSIQTQRLLFVSVVVCAARNRVALGLLRGLRGALPAAVGRVLSPRVAALPGGEQRLRLHPQGGRAAAGGERARQPLPGQVDGAAHRQGARGRAHHGAHEDDRGDGELGRVPHAPARPPPGPRLHVQALPPGAPRPPDHRRLHERLLARAGQEPGEPGGRADRSHCHCHCHSDKCNFFSGY